MAESGDKAKDVVHAVEHAVEHPIETAKELEEEAAKGESARTPLIALTLYFVYGGK